MEILLTDRQAFGHMRAHAIIVSVNRMLVVACSLQVRDILALAVFDVGEAKRSFIVQCLNACNEIYLRVVIGAEPSDREVAPCPDS